MPWVYGDQGDPINEHEGTALGVLADGAVPTELVGSRRFPRSFVEETWFGNGAEPEESATWQRPVCACGWSGTDVPVDGTQEPDDHDPDHTIRASDQAARRQWEDHVEVLVTRRDADEWTNLARTMVSLIGGLPDPLERLRRLARIEEHVADHKVAAVNQAREDDVTWSAVGGALGMSRSAAHSKYHRLVSEVAAELDVGMPETPDELDASLDRMNVATEEARAAALRLAARVDAETGERPAGRPTTLPG